MPAPARRTVAAMGVAAIYAVCFVAIKAGLVFAPPLLFAGLRAEIAAAALLAVVVFLRRPVLPAVTGWPGLVALAVTSTSLGFGAMFLSPGRAGAGIAAVLGNVQPLLVLVLAATFLSEPLTRAKVIALLLGLAGVTLISLPAIGGADTYGISGLLLALGSSASLAVGNVILKKVGTSHDLLTMTVWQLGLGGLVLLALARVLEAGAQVTWTGTFVALLLGLALAGTAVPYVAWNHLARNGEIGRLTLHLLLVPVFGVALAVIFYDEPFGPFELVGLAATAAAVGIAAVGTSARPGAVA